MSQVVLITGCSTGIGHDLAQRLTRAGYTVIATARKVEALNEIQAALKLPLDVTQPDSINQAVKQITQRLNRIDVLVNNAGYAIRGAVEELDDQLVQQMFDVNVRGAMRMCRAVLPHMRAQKAGRIVNIGSVAGKFSLPVNGTYSATKFALEALSDSLRIELSAFGIPVVLIEPGNIRTNFLATSQTYGEPILSNPNSPYRNLYQQYLQNASVMRRGEPGPEVVSRVVQHAIETRKPKARYMVAVPFTSRLGLLLPDSLRDFVIQRLYRINR